MIIKMTLELIRLDIVNVLSSKPLLTLSMISGKGLVDADAWIHQRRISLPALKDSWSDVSWG